MFVRLRNGSEPLRTQLVKPHLFRISIVIFRRTSAQKAEQHQKCVPMSAREARICSFTTDLFRESCAKQPPGASLASSRQASNRCPI